MEASSNFPPEFVITGDTTWKNPPDLMSVPDEELLLEIPIGEERIEKFMQELYKEITTAARTTTAANKPSPAVASYPSESSFLWNGWERERERESCGAAFSDSASTVMAGVEFAGNMISAPENGGRCGCKCRSNEGLVVGKREEGAMNGCDACGVGHGRKVDGGDDDDEEWFARVLSWGPADLVPGFWNDVHYGGSS